MASGSVWATKQVPVPERDGGGGYAVRKKGKERSKFLSWVKNEFPWPDSRNSGCLKRMFYHQHGDMCLYRYRTLS